MNSNFEGQILSNIHNNSISDLVSFKDIALNKEKYKDYIFSNIDFEDLYKSYPFLENEPIYCLAGFLNSTPYYFDGNYLFTIPIQVFNDEKGGYKADFLWTVNTEDDYNNFKKSAKKKFDENKFYLIIQSEGLIVDVIKKKVKDKKISYDDFIGLYTFVDFGFSKFTSAELDTVFSLKSQAKKNKTRKALDDITDDDFITVFRGEGEKSARNGVSWSTDINIAVFFASRLSGNDGRILKGRVKKDKVIEYIEDRGEKEVICKYSDVENIEVIPLNSVEECVAFFEGYSLYQKYRSIIKAFPVSPRSNTNSDHDKKHLLRVLFLGLVMIYREYFDEGVYFDDEELETFATALALHDVGRDNDVEDIFHGAKSYKKIKSSRIIPSGLKNKKLEFLLTYHCRDDREALQYCYDNFGNIQADERERLIIMFNLLKDADALDRVRFGIRDLDVNYLRTPNAIRYVILANQCLSGLEL